MLVRGLVGWYKLFKQMQERCGFYKREPHLVPAEEEKKNFEIISANPSICFLQEQLQRSYDISPSFFSSPAINIRPSFSYLW
jgi:hypothetical protein